MSQPGRKSTRLGILLPLVSLISWGQINPGDANGDGRINRLDKDVTLSVIMNQGTASGIADCNQDGQVNVLDIICITNKILTDDTAPDIEITAPAEGTVTQSTLILVQGTVSDDVGATVLTIGGQNAAPASDGSFDKTVSLLPGPNTIVVSAQGAAGNATTEQVTIHCDQTAPTIVVNSPEMGSVVDCTTTTLQATVQDDLAVDHADVIIKNPWNEAHANENGGLGYIVTYANVPIGAGGQLSWQLDLVDGQNLIEIQAWDVAGNWSQATHHLICDQKAPQIRFQDPKPGHSIYDTVADVVILYNDFSSDIDTGSLEIRVEDVNGVDVTGSLTIDMLAEESQATGTIAGLQTDEIYTIFADISDVRSNTGSTESAIYVADSAIIEPDEPEDAGHIIGYVLDSSSCDQYMNDCDGVPAAIVQVTFEGGASLLNKVGEPPSIATGPDGFFSFPVAETGRYWISVQKQGYTFAQRIVEVVKERETSCGQLFLTPLDQATLFDDTNGNGAYDPGEEISQITDTGGMAVTSGIQTDGTAWEITASFPPGAVSHGNPLDEINLTWFEHVEYLPSGSLPPGTAETFALDASGSNPLAGVQFNTPVTLKFKDTRGFPATFPATGDIMKIPVGYWNKDTLAWEHAGDALAVDEDTNGTTDFFEFETLHFSPFDCNDPVAEPRGNAETKGGDSGDSNSGTRNGDKRDKNEKNKDKKKRDKDEPCPTDDAAGSRVSLHSGDLFLKYDLIGPGIVSDVPMALVYKSGAAHPSVIISSSQLLSSDGTGEFTRFGRSVEFAGQTSPITWFSVPEDNLYRDNFFFLGQNSTGTPLKTGSYGSAIKTDARYWGQYFYTQNGEFGGPPDLRNGATGLFTETINRNEHYGRATIHNLVKSPFGAGWTLAGMERLTESEDGFAMVAEGTRVHEFYLRNVDLLPPPVINNPWIATTSQGTDMVSCIRSNLAVNLDEARVECNGTFLHVFSSDSSFCYTLSGQKVSKIDLVTREIVLELSLGSSCTMATLNPDGSLLFVSHRYDATVSVINTATLSLQTTLSVDERPVRMTCLPNGGFLVVRSEGTSSYDDETIQFVELPALTVGPSISIRRSSGDDAMVATPNSEFLYVGTMLGVDVVNISTQTVDDELVLNPSFGLDAAFAVTSDSNFVYVSNANSSVNKLYVIDTSTQSISSQITVHSSASFLTIDPTDQYLYICQNLDDSISLLELASNTLTGSIDVPGPRSAHFSHDGSLLAVNGDDSILFLDAISLEPLAEFPWTTYWIGPREEALCFSSQDDEIMFITDDTSGGRENLYFVDLARIASVAGSFSFDVGNPQYSMNRIPDTDLMVVTHHADDSVSAFSFDADPDLFASTDVGNNPRDVAVSPDGKFAFVANKTDNSVSVIELANFSKIRDVQLSASPERFLFRPDGQFLYVFSDTMASVLSTKSLDLITEISFAADNIPALSKKSYNEPEAVPSPDGTRIYAIKTIFDEVIVLDAVSHNRLTSSMFVDSPIHLAVTSNGYFLYVAESSEKVSVFDLSDQSQVGFVNIDRAMRVAITPDDRFAYILSRQISFPQTDALVHVMDVQTHSLIGSPISVDYGSSTFPTDIVAGPIGQYVFVLDEYADMVTVISTTTQSVVGRFLTGRMPGKLFVEGTGQQFGRGIPISPIDQSILTQDLDESSLDFGTYTHVYLDGTEVHFNLDGTHDTTLDRHGNLSVYSYNPDGTLAQIEQQPANQTQPTTAWEFAYQSGKLQSITNHAGGQYQIDIDQRGDLISVENPKGGIRRFSYDERHLPLTKTLETGETFMYRYDHLGRVKEHLSPERLMVDDLGNITMGRERRQYQPTLTQQVVNDPLSPISGTEAVPATPLKYDDLLAGFIDGRGNQKSYRTNLRGGLEKKIDALGRETEYERDKDNNLVKIVYPNGSCVEYTYDAMGNVLTKSKMGPTQCGLPPGDRDPNEVISHWYTYERQYQNLISATDARGNITQYLYDTLFDTNGDGTFTSADAEYAQFEANWLSQGSRFFGNLWKIEHPEVEVYDTDTHQTTNQTPTERFAYNARGQIVEEVDPTGVITQYQYTPDAYSWMTQASRDVGGLNVTTQYSDFDAFGNPQTVIDPNGNTTEYEYDPLTGEKTAEIEYVDLDGNGTPEPIRTEVAYDARGNLTRITRDKDGPMEFVEETDYNAHDEWTRISQEYGDTTWVRQRFFDATRKPKIVEDANGNRTFFGYDEAKQLTAYVKGWSPTQPDGIYKETYTYDDGSGCTSCGNYHYKTGIIFPNGSETRYVYDEFGRRIQTIANFVDGGVAPNENLTTTYTFDADDQITHVENPAGTVTTYVYDALDRLKTKTLDYTEDGITGLNLVSTYAHDLSGNRVLARDHSSTETLFEYDALNRVESKTRDFTPDGVTGHNLTTDFTFDANGNVLTRTDPSGTVLGNTYDERNRRISKTVDVGGLDLETTYAYDRLGNRRSVVDPAGMETVRQFDGFNQLVSEIQDQGGRQIQTQFQFDGNGNTTALIDSHGNTTVYTYNALNRVDSVTYANGTYEHLVYEDGLLQSRQTQNGDVFSYSYDPLHRLTDIQLNSAPFQSFTYTTEGWISEGTDETSNSVVGFVHDALGRVTSSTQTIDTQTQSVGYAYNDLARSETITYPGGQEITRTWDPVFRLSTVTDLSGTIGSYSFDVPNRNWTLSYPNGLATTHQYDASGRKLSVNSGMGHYAYTYDAAGNRTSMQRLHKAGSPYDAYEYDTTYQVTGVKYSTESPDYASATTFNRQEEFFFDKLGNRLQSTDDGVPTEYGPNDGTQLLDEMNQYDAVDHHHFRYDANGNVLEDEENTYTFDAADRLTQATKRATGVTASYAFDAFGRRIAKDVDGSITHFFYDGLQVIEERSDSGVLSKSFVYGWGLDEPLRMTTHPSGDHRFYHFDALGSITELSDAAGAFVEAYEYDVFGRPYVFDDAARSNEIDPDQGVGNPYLFSGRRFDAESGNYHYRARSYAPNIGRFLSPDPIGFDDHVNRYAFVKNNPIRFRDPWGLFCTDNPFLDDPMIRDMINSLSEQARNNEPYEGECDDFWESPDGTIEPYPIVGVTDRETWFTGGMDETGSINEDSMRNGVSDHPRESNMFFAFDAEFSFHFHPDGDLAASNLDITTFNSRPGMDHFIFTDDYVTQRDRFGNITRSWARYKLDEPCNPCEE